MRLKPAVIYSIAALFSLLLSLISGLRLDVINPDAICYLQSAKMTAQGLHAVMQTCPQANWPLYSILIFAVTQLTHTSAFLSAFLLNSLFSVISVISFIAIIRFFVNKQRMMWLGAFVILLAYEFNIVRPDIIRDHGFWAFYLVSIWCLLNYFRDLRWRFALGWGASLVIATLFRIEGGVFLLLLPFLALCDTQLTWGSRLKSFLQLNTLTVLGVIGLFVFMLVHPVQDLSRLNELQYQLLHGWNVVSAKFVHRADLLGQYVLGSEGERDRYITLFSALLGSYIIQIIFNLSIIYALLVGYAWYKRLLEDERQSHWVLWGYVFVNVLITLPFLVEHLFLSKRYLMALSLVLMIWIPFSLNHLLMQWRQRKSLVMLVFAIVLLCSVGGIIRFGYSKTYIRDAGLWLAQQVPADKSLYSNDIQLMYYSDHFGNAIFSKAKEYTALPITDKNAWRHFDYLAVRSNQDDPQKNTQLQQMTHLIPVKTFSNRRGDQVVIYKVSP